MRQGRLLPRVLLLSCLTLTSLLFLWLALNYRQSSSLPIEPSPVKPERASFPPTPSLCADEFDIERVCASFPNHLLIDVQITIKTGIGERPQLEALLNSYASCISNVIIVSDASDTVHGHEVHDILADLPTTYAYNNTDWDAYTDQHQALAAGDPVRKTSAGWRLDRFKFLPMIEHTYARRSNAKWYVFIETDTYFFWDTLFRVLERLDPDEPHYLGSAAPGAEDRWFAYGGAGFVLSQGTLRNLSLSGDQRLSVRYEWMSREDCCGDAVLGYVLHAELGVRLGNMHPTFSGEEPQWVAVRRENWCTPLLSLHHVNAELMESLWRWERCRASTEQAITFATYLDWSLAPVFVDGKTTRSHWDNGADIKHRSMFITSDAACFAACERSKTCLQASYSEGACRFAEFLRPGQAVATDTQSSWDLMKLERLNWRPGADDSSALCSETKWLPPKIMLPPKDWAQYFHLKQWP